jgi:FkbM family methyltransferase
VSLAEFRKLVLLALPRALSEGVESRRFFRSRGFTLRSLAEARRAWLARLDLLPEEIDLRTGLIVDIGANEGDFTMAVLSLAPEARIIAVEPAEAPRQRLSDKVAAAPNVAVVGKAVAAAPGTARFRLTAHSHNSSLRVPRGDTGEFYEDSGWDVVEEVEIETTSLDDVVGDQKVALLKVDVQGGEREVLEGGSRTLGRTRAVMIEMTFFSHYEGDAGFEELHEQMTGFGFELVSMAPPGRAHIGAPSWVDALYVRPAAATSSR